jgi:hypothetical protein
MRENRTYGSEGGEPSNGSLPYPYRSGAWQPSQRRMVLCLPTLPTWFESNPYQSSPTGSMIFLS